MSDQKQQRTENKADIKEALMNLLNSSSTGGSQYVTFRIATEEYGIEIKSVQEITGYKKLNEVPNTPDYVAGIYNLRGSVIPIMDPRIKFGLETIDHTKDSVIIIFNSKGKTVGMIVDEVRDVLTIEKENIDETPELSLDLSTEYINGIGKVGGKFIVILSTANLFSAEELKKAEE